MDDLHTSRGWQMPGPPRVSVVAQQTSPRSHARRVPVAQTHPWLVQAGCGVGVGPAGTAVAVGADGAIVGTGGEPGHVLVNISGAPTWT